MRLWETYFRLWDRLSHDLTEGSTQKEPEEKPIREEKRGNDYYGYTCDVGTCVESGI
jgi:hypothetical protein